MNKFLFFAIIALTLSACSSEKTKFIDDNFKFAQEQTRGMFQVATDVTLFPRTTNKNGTLKQTDMYDWTSGFFAGNLWYLYEYSNDPFWKEKAIAWTESLEPLKHFTHHHDLGFMMYCSYGNAYRLTKNPKYIDILIKSAESLSSRYSEQTKTIKSWNYRLSWDGKSEWFYPVIIDNMMNLELLMFAYKQTGNESFKNVAITHTETTLKHHFRDDFSTYHVIDYDTITGNVLHKQTMQGFSDNSTWARGQAWAIYGFSMMYREVGDPRYLEAAVKAADLFLNHKNLPEDLIPLWDFNAFDQGYVPHWKTPSRKEDLRKRDASAAAIVASALFELAESSPENSKRYYDSAVAMLHNLSKNYKGELGNNNNFILKHSVGSFPHNEEIDVPLVYADYYFLEALLRYKKK